MSLLALSRSLTRLAPRQSQTVLAAAIASSSSSTTTTQVSSSQTFPSAATTTATPFIRHFHSSSLLLSDNDGEDSFSAKDELMDILAREHAEEKENDSTTLPEELKELRDDLTNKGGWKVVDAPDTAITRMIKTHAKTGLKVQISFHCQDTVESMEGEEEMVEPEEPATDEEAADEEVEPSVPLRFTVLASKAGQTLVFTCLTEQGVAQIQSVALATTDDETSILNSGAVAADHYQGPEFVELAQDLQYAYQNFLEQEEDGVGITEDVAAFIAMYADYKEQTQYVQFLEKCQKILS